MNSILKRLLVPFSPGERGEWGERGEREKGKREGREGREREGEERRERERREREKGEKGEREKGKRKEVRPVLNQFADLIPKPLSVYSMHKEEGRVSTLKHILCESIWKILSHWRRGKGKSGHGLLFILFAQIYMLCSNKQ